MSVPIYFKTIHTDTSKHEATRGLTSGTGATQRTAQGHSHTSSMLSYSYHLPSSCQIMQDPVEAVPAFLLPAAATVLLPNAEWLVGTGCGAGIAAQSGPPRLQTGWLQCFL